ncbi:MAG: WD40 repeat domain-containing protein [Candidatus Aminicenantes bacterium]|nr:MAG: WD40 repeat domain-containing protein [Candidatus Aminicenantes bacterium]
MKKYSIFLIVLALVLGGCSKVKVIPEISPHLSEIHVLDLTDKNLSKTLLENNSELVFTTLDGKLFRWDAEKKIVNFLYNLNSDIQPDIFSQDNTLILEQLKPGQYSIFDLNEMKQVASLQNRKMERIVGLDHQVVVYLANKEIHIYNYRSNQLLKSMKIGKRKAYNVYNSEFRGNSLYILSTHYLYIYDKSSDVVERIELKRLAASGFLLDGDMMYYGSSQRELVKFSIKSRKIAWAFKIAEVLKIKPGKIGPYVVIIPEDNNIYFFNKNGSLYWWEKLNSTRLLPPVLMKENVVVFLWDKKIKFFNYKKKQVTTYPLNRKVKTNPVCIGDYIYVVSEVKPGEESQEEEIPGHLQLSKIGNHYGVEITSEPQYVKPMGKSIRFNLQVVNLVEPQFKIKIFKNQPGNETPVYDKILNVDDKPSFVWIPGEAVEYRMIVEVEAENKKGLTVEERFKTVDVEEILRNYYYQLHSRCDSNSFN